MTFHYYRRQNCEADLKKKKSAEEELSLKRKQLNRCLISNEK